MAKHVGFGRLLEVAMWKKCTPLWRGAHFEVNMYKTPQLRATFGSCDVEKVHAVAARSTFGSKKWQNTWCSDHFWTLPCRKSARRWGAKHVLSKNVQITACSGHFWTSRCCPAVEKLHASVARSTFPSQKCQKLRVLSHFCCVRCRFVDRWMDMEKVS